MIVVDYHTRQMDRMMSFKHSNKLHRLINSKKKRGFFGLLTLSFSVILGVWFFFISWLSGFVIARNLGSKEVGKPSKLPSIILPLGKLKIHLHHWFICSIVIVITLLKGCWFLPSELLHGFLAGIAAQGVYYYNDWYKIIKRRQRKIRLLSKLN